MMLQQKLKIIIKNNPFFLSLASKIYYYINKNTKNVNGGGRSHLMALF